MQPSARSCRRAAALLLLAAALPAQATILALGGRDPVALCQGQDVQGQDDLTAEHFLYVYRFADEANRKTFLADPERWCIQMGGGCGRMGPLSGKGDPTRWLVHDGRVYIFASDQCRDTFAKNPERFVFPARKELGGDADARAKGRDALVRAVAALGGRDRIATWKAVAFAREQTAKTDKGDRRDTWRKTLGSSGDVRVDETWGDWRSTTVAAGGDGFFIENSGLITPMHQTGIDELRRASLADPLWLLRQLDAAGFEAVRTGDGEVDGRAVDLVAVRWGPVDTTLAVARDDGAILQQRFVGRTPQLAYGELVITRRDFRDVGGLSLPHTLVTAVGGKEAGTRTFAAIELDPELPEGYFARPR